MKTRMLIFFLAIAGSLNMAYARSAEAESIYYADAYADHYGVPRPLVYAIIEQESGWNCNAISSEGALGLMQLMPTTARFYDVSQPFAKSDNIGGGVRYLRALLREFHGDMRLAVAAYYTGGGRIQRRGLAFENPAVVAYVEQVRRRYLRELKRHNSPVPEGSR